MDNQYFYKQFFLTTLEEEINQDYVGSSSNKSTSIIVNTNLGFSSGNYRIIDGEFCRILPGSPPLNMI